MKNGCTLPRKDKIKNSIRYIRSQINIRPKVGIILGSGLSDFVKILESTVLIPLKEIPSYPDATVEGHSGNIYFGKINNKWVVVFQGRIHYYETGSLEDSIFHVDIAHRLGVKTLVITNAAGGVNPSFKAGDLMLIFDQINLMFKSIPLHTRVSIRDNEYYDTEYLNKAILLANREGIQLQKGVYCGLTGPSYETISEIRMLQTLGADAVGMSTVNEVIHAKNLGMRTLGISYIANQWNFCEEKSLSHTDVIAVGTKLVSSFTKFIQSFLKNV